MSPCEQTVLEACWWGPSSQTSDATARFAASRWLSAPSVKEVERTRSSRLSRVRSSHLNSFGSSAHPLGRTRACAGVSAERRASCAHAEFPSRHARPFGATLAGVREASGEIKASNVVKIEDWAEGPKEVVMFEDILSAYPKKVLQICRHDSQPAFVPPDG